jgi:two-component system, cell cycle response regulator
MDPTLTGGADDLTTRLARLEGEARQNEAKLSRLFEREVALLSAGTLPQLLQSLVRETPPVFSIEAATLVVRDQAAVIHSLLELRGDSAGNWPQLIVAQDVDAVSPLYRGLTKPWLGTFNSEAHGSLFEDDLVIESFAAVPLYCRGERVGVLNLGSRDSQRYAWGLGTEFLERFGTILAIALVNVSEREQLMLMGLTDALTGLPNRRCFMERMLQEMSRASRYGQSTACVYVDLDHFKSINDQYGHGAGDGVLREVSRRLRGMVRSADVPARLGGEEFALLLPQTEEAAAFDLSERVRAYVSAHPVEIAGIAEGIQITASFGVASVIPQRDAPDLEGYSSHLLDAADSALMHAKQSGRNRVVAASSLSVL